MQNLTLKEKIAQMLICGIEGTTVDSAAKELICNEKVGGIILYSKNTPTAHDTFSLTYSLQELALATKGSLPLFIAIDEEHGRVSRIKEGTTHFIDMASVGKLNDTEIVKEIASITSRELIACGINVNFAPVCDVNVNPKNEVIGDRSFSNDPKVVASLVEAYIKEGVEQKMILSAKHFPGHGDTSIDSHLKLPVVQKTLAELEKCELIPFESAIKAGVQMIMTAHILFPKIDNLPATMSKKIITELLLDRFWFNGVIISDDMCMGAIAENYGMEEAFTRSINAGVNMFIISNMLKHKADVSKIIGDIEKSVKSGVIKEDLIDVSIEKILKLKKKYVKETFTEKVLRERSLRQKTSLHFAEYLAERKRGMIG